MVPAASVVIPAHDEARVIVRTLEALHSGLEPGALDVVVVCNGCTDATAGLARAFSPAVRILEIPVASKAAAVRAGNEASEVFPRVHLDADVQLTGPDLLALVRPLVEGEVLATAPRRVLPREGSARLVRWYYDVWEELPQVRAGLFGRGAIALSEAGQRRVDALPQLMSDDLGLSEAFDPGERLVVETAQVVVLPPRTVRDMVRRRIRVVTGNVQASRSGIRRRGSVTGVRSLVGLAASRPSLVPRLPAFLGLTLVARLSARRAVRSGDFATWLRDDSSRA